MMDFLQLLLQTMSKILTEPPQRHPHCPASIYLLWKGVSRDPLLIPCPNLTTWEPLKWKKNVSRYCKGERGQDDRSSASECLKARC